MEVILEIPILVNLPFEYEHRLFTKQQIDRLTDNTVERLKVGSIERSFDKIMCVVNPKNYYLNHLPFDWDQRLITIQLVYITNDNIIERLNNSSIVDIYTNQM